MMVETSVSGYLRHCLKTWNWRLFAFITLFLGLPNIYQLYRVHLIGTGIPDTGSLAIVSQWQFVSLAIEVFQEGTVLAIFFFLGSQIRSGTHVQLERTKSVFTFIFLASLVFSAGIFLFRNEFITFIGTPEDIRTQTSNYLGISIFSVPFTILAAAIVVLFESLGLRSLVFVMAIANVALRFGFDSLFFGGYGFSLDAGVTGVGWATLLASVGLLASGLLLLIRVKEIPLESLRTLPSFKDMQEYLWVSLGSGIDSLIRNIAYLFMIIRIVNTIGSAEIGGYYVTIQILWSFMLVPVLALADSLKALVANSSSDIERVRVLWHSAIIITTVFMVIWIIIVPIFPSFAKVITNDTETIKWAVTAFGFLFVPYVLFSFNTVTDSVFYGLGQTKYLAYQSIIVNGSVYLVAFLLYHAGAWKPSFEGVMVLFGLGILFDSFFTAGFLVKVLYFSPERNTKRATDE